MIIATLPNSDYGIEAVVSQIGASQFSVAIHDTDADEYLDTVKIYPTLEQAMEFANACAA